MDSRMYALDDDGLVRAEMPTDSPWTISYLRAGEDAAPRLIYVHGTPGSATNFNAYLHDPVPGWEAISIDRPGFGQTQPRIPSSSLEEQARLIEPVLVERNGRWPILIGHSLGGPIVCRVAADYPDRVGGLVILSGSMDPDLERVWWIQRFADFAFMPYLIPRALRNANQEVLPLRDELRELEPLLANIDCPIVIVHSRDDSLVQYENVHFMQRAFSGDRIAALHELNGKDHFVPWNAQHTVRQAILDAIDAHSIARSER
jgi:pimeloyl-ACP methyl ester carboxylesterase